MTSTVRIIDRGYSVDVDIYNNKRFEMEWEDLRAQLTAKCRREESELTEYDKKINKDYEDWLNKSFWNRFKKYPKQSEIYRMRGVMHEKPWLKNNTDEERWAIKELLTKHGYVLISDIEDTEIYLLPHSTNE